MDQLPRERMAQDFLAFQGKAKKKTTPKQNRKTAKEALMQIAKERGWYS